MNMLAKAKERPLAVLVTAVLFLAALGSVSSNLLVGGAPNNTVPSGVDRQLSALRVESVRGGAQSRALSKDENAKGARPESIAIGGVADAQTPPAVLPPLQDRVIKSGSVTLKVKKGKFGAAFEQVIMIAQVSGGYVAGSSSASADDRLASGALTIRVPSKNFELVLAKLRRVGKLTAMDVNSQDVSTEFVDLESRLRHWRAQEAILLNLMNKATNIADSITVQQQLSQVQMEIEQITGRLNFLKDQTTYSSLSVAVNEPGIGPKPLDPWGFRAAVRQGAHAFVDTFNGLIVLAGYLSPLLLLAGLAGLVWAGVRGRLSLAGPGR